MCEVERLALNTRFPLYTQQLRFRGLNHVYLYHPTCQGGHSPDRLSEFYLSFHETALSSPFLTTPPACPQDHRLSWPELLVPQEQSGLKGTVLRIWMKNASGSVSLAVLGIYFSGLVCVGDSLLMKTVQYLEPNSLVFKLHGHYFVGPDSFNSEIKVPLIKYINLPSSQTASAKPSYDKPALAEMQRTLRALKQMNLGNARLKGEILHRGLDLESADHCIQTQTTSLLQQIFNKQEKEALLSEINEKKKQYEVEVAETEKAIDFMTAKFHELSKDKEKLGDWMKTFDEFRGYKEKASSDLVTRRKQLISQLQEIFPINDANTSLPTIGYVCLPETDNLKDRDDTEVSVGLGWTAHLTLMISSLLTIPPRYHINHFGSRSGMVDYALDKIPDKDRLFPLYPKGVERTRFDYAVYLLNKDIAQLRWFCDESTSDLRSTLRNLDGLLRLLTCARGDPVLTSSPRLNLPLAPPVLSGVATILSRGTPPGSSLSDLEVNRDQTSSDPTDTEAEEVQGIIEGSSDSSDDNCKPGGVQNTLKQPFSSVICDTIETVRDVVLPQDSLAVEPCPDSTGLDGGEGFMHLRTDEENPAAAACKAGNQATTSGQKVGQAADALPGAAAAALELEDNVSCESPGGEGNEAAERNVELGVAADMFWDSVTSRAQVLSFPASFKTSKQKPFRQF